MTILSHGSLTWLSGICGLGWEVLDLMFKPPMYWNPLSSPACPPARGEILRGADTGLQWKKSNKTLPSPGDRLASESTCQVCLQYSTYFSFFSDSQIWWSIHDKDHLSGKRLEHKLNTFDGTGPYIIYLPLGYWMYFKSIAKFWLISVVQDLICKIKIDSKCFISEIEELYQFISQ